MFEPYLQFENPIAGVWNLPRRTAARFSAAAFQFGQAAVAIDAFSRTTRCFFRATSKVGAISAERKEPEVTRCGMRQALRRVGIQSGSGIVWWCTWVAVRFG